MKNKFITMVLVFSSVGSYAQDSKSEKQVERATRLEVGGALAKASGQAAATGIGCSAIYLGKGARMGIVVISESTPVLNAVSGFVNFFFHGPNMMNSDTSYMNFKRDLQVVERGNDWDTRDVYSKSQIPSLWAGGILTAIGEGFGDTVDFIDGRKIQDHELKRALDIDGWFDKTKKVYVMTQYYAKNDKESLDIRNPDSWCSKMKRSLNSRAQVLLDKMHSRGLANSLSATHLTTDTSLEEDHVAAVKEANAAAATAAGAK